LSFYNCILFISVKSQSVILPQASREVQRIMVTSPLRKVIRKPAQTTIKH